MSNPFDKESLTQREKDLLQDGGWQCSFCGTVNASYITTCACSHNQDDSYENLHGRYVPREDEEWSEAGITIEAPEESLPASEPAMQASAFQPAETEPAFTTPAPASEPAFTPSTPSTPSATEAAMAQEPVSSPAAAPASKASVSNTNRPMEEYTEYEQGILRDGGWECAFCSRINANYITTCACGHSTDDSYLKRRGRYVAPEGEEEETAAPEPAATVSAEPETEAASQNPEPMDGAAMIAQIEAELKKNDTPTARLRAIRKFKDLNKKGFMTDEDLNQRMDELMGFDDDEESSEDSE